MRVFSIEDPVFKTEPLFILGCSFAQLDAYLKAKFRVTAGTTSTGHAGTMLTLNQPPWRVVWARRLDLPVILHEVFHLVTRICYDKGIPVCALDDAERNHLDEPAAYLFEHFARGVLKQSGLWRRFRA